MHSMCSCSSSRGEEVSEMPSTLHALWIFQFAVVVMISAHASLAFTMGVIPNRSHPCLEPLGRAAPRCWAPVRHVGKAHLGALREELADALEQQEVRRGGRERQDQALFGQARQVAHHLCHAFLCACTHPQSVEPWLCKSCSAQLLLCHACLR